MLSIKSSNIWRRKGTMVTKCTKFSMCRQALAEKHFKEPQLQQQNLRKEAMFTWRWEWQSTLQSMLNRSLRLLPRLRPLPSLSSRHTNFWSTRPSQSILTMKVATNGLKYSFQTWLDLQIIQKKMWKSSSHLRDHSQWRLTTLKVKIGSSQCQRRNAESCHKHALSVINQADFRSHLERRKLQITGTACSKARQSVRKILTKKTLLPMLKERQRKSEFDALV